MQTNHARLPGYPDCYVTRDGRVISNGKEKVPIQKKNRAPQVRLQHNKQTRHYGLATLVATHFVPNPDGHTRVICADGNNRNCAAANLRWISHREFSRYNICKGRSLEEKPQRKRVIKEKSEKRELWKREPKKRSRKRKGQAVSLVPSDPLCLPIPGFPYYYASPSGNVWSKNRKLTPQYYGSGGRVKVKPQGGKLLRHSVARLVALTFLPNPDGYRHFIFRNRNKRNCEVTNLQWVSEFSYRSWYQNSGTELLGEPRRRKKPVPPPVARHPESKPLEGHEGYFISPEGVVYKGDRLVHLSRCKGKAQKVKLRIGTAVPAVYQYLGLATLMAQHFIPNPREHLHIIFKDRNHHNYHRDNIAWVDGETFMWYCGATQKVIGRKKIVVDREVAIQVTSHPLLRQYYKTGDTYWLEEAWKEVEGKLSRMCWDWQKLRSDCYLYFADRARRFSIKRDPTGLLLSYIKGIRSRLKAEISGRMPIHQLLTTDESLRNRNNDYDEGD